MSREGWAECSRCAGQLIKPGVRLALAVGFLLLPQGDSCGPQSKITMSVVAGTTYFIVVDGFATDAGNFTLSVL